MIKISLKTHDQQDARNAHARLLAKIEAQSKQLSAGVLSLSRKQAVAMSREILRDLVLRHEDNAGKRLAPSRSSSRLELDLPIK